MQANLRPIYTWLWNELQLTPHKILKVWHQLFIPYVLMAKSAVCKCKWVARGQTPHSVVVHLSSPYLIWRSEKWQRGGRLVLVSWLAVGLGWVGDPNAVAPRLSSWWRDGNEEERERAQIGLGMRPAGSSPHLECWCHYCGVIFHTDCMPYWFPEW